MKERKERIDKKHRFPIRIAEESHNILDTLAFRHRISLNLLYVDAIHYAMDHVDFRSLLELKYPIDTRRGHFSYVGSTNPYVRGRIL
jgi:hypothetical protein